MWDCMEQPIHGPLSVINVGVSAQTKQTDPCHKEKRAVPHNSPEGIGKGGRQRTVSVVCLCVCLFSLEAQERALFPQLPHNFSMRNLNLL